MFKLLDVKATDFSPNMNQRQIANLLALEYTPSYKVDCNGYIEFERGLLLKNQFVIIETLGSGVFSKVLKAANILNGTLCAIKITRNEERFKASAKRELKILRDIVENDCDSVCIHLQSEFSFKGHQCFIFNVYGPSIYQVLQSRKYQRFSNEVIKSVSYQICKAIAFLHSINIIFTDLKPENCIFVTANPTIDARIKLIDFGSAIYYNEENRHCQLIQTRHYRAPEVILGMRWMHAVDVWS